MKIFKVFVLTCLIFSAGLMHGIIVQNFSECAFQNECEYEKNNVSHLHSGSSIKATIVLGASNFLESQMYYNQFLHLYEIGDLHGADIDKQRSTINRAIEKMEFAYSYYYELCLITMDEEYNGAITDRLRDFDYHGFKEEMGLRLEVFLEVKRYLQNANVKGIYWQSFLKTGSILNSLYEIKYALGCQKIPDVYHVWQLNQKYCDTLLFGQYVAMIFKAII